MWAPRRRRPAPTSHMAFHLLALLFFALQRHEPAGAADAGAHDERFAVIAGAAVAAADQHCTTGLLDSSSSFCCPKKCGRCGGSSCQNRPGGRADCCTGSIKGSHRYCDSAGPPCIMGGAPPPPAPLHPAHTVNPKRGYVADSPDCGDALLLNASGWFYDYNAVNPYREPRKSVGDCARAAELGRIDERFVPMNWCLDGMDATVAPTVNRTFFMGFNEPNNAHNCNTSPEKVAAAWGTVMKNWSSTSQLVSPATAGNGRDNTLLPFSSFLYARMDLNAPGPTIGNTERNTHTHTLINCALPRNQVVRCVFRGVSEALRPGGLPD